MRFTAPHFISTASNQQSSGFIVCCYHANAEGKFVPDFPTVCPCHTNDGPVCKLCFDHNRDRKTGPPFALFVFRRGSHHKGFSVYPPGYTPYGRQQLVAVGPDGVLTEATEEAHRFSSTVFEAALDAGEGISWPQENQVEVDKPLFITQIRHLKKTALLLGIQPKLSEREREVFSQILGVDGQRLFEQSQLIKNQPSSLVVGQAVCHVLEALPLNARLFENLAYAGSQAGLWSTPLIWDARSKVLRAPSFPLFGTRSPP